MEAVCYVFDTEMGWAGIAGSERLIRRLVLPRSSREAALEALHEGNALKLVEQEHDFSGQAARIAAYFAGERVRFECELDFCGAGDFDRRVWAATQEIAYGDVESYGWIAARIGQPHAARAVGGALGRNPIPVIVPCHRVIHADGALGGFGCGLEWKIRLLGLERGRH